MAATPPKNRQARRSKTVDVDAPVKFLYQGETYEAPHPDKWPFKILGMLNRGQIEEVLAILLGPDQTATLLRDDITVGEVNTFFDVLKEAAGSGN